MARILHLLALHPSVQDKMRQEIIEARKECQDRELSYDELVALPYLDAVCRETLRLWVYLASSLNEYIQLNLDLPHLLGMHHCPHYCEGGSVYRRTLLNKPTTCLLGPVKTR